MAMKLFTTLILLLVVSTRAAGEYRLCGHAPSANGLQHTASAKMCTSWEGNYCPDANHPAPADVRPGKPEDDVMTAGLAQCEPGFMERLLCEAPAQDSCGEDCRYRVCYGDTPSTGAGVSGSMLVETKEGQARVDALKVGDEIRGRSGYQKKKDWCKVQSITLQGEGDLYESFTSQQMIEENKNRIVSNALYEAPKIVEASIEKGYQIFTDCELVSNSEGVQFTPLSTTFCGKHRTSWNTYYILYQAIAGIVEKTGSFWFDLNNFKDCPLDADGATTCRYASWRTALPPVCTMMLTCARVKSEAACTAFDNLALSFVSEHILDEHASTFKQAYANEQTLGADLKAMDVSEDSDRHWWQIDWSFWEDDEIDNDSTDWEDPWVWVAVIVGTIVVAGAIFCIWSELKKRPEKAALKDGLMEDYSAMDSSTHSVSVGERTQSLSDTNIVSENTMPVVV